MFWLNTVLLFHLGGSAVSGLFVKIKFTLTFLPIFIHLMCVSTRRSLCACAIAPMHVYEYLLASESNHALYLNRPILQGYWGHYHVRGEVIGVCGMALDSTVT